MPRNAVTDITYYNSVRNFIPQNKINIVPRNEATDITYYNNVRNFIPQVGDQKVQEFKRNDHPVTAMRHQNEMYSRSAHLPYHQPSK